MSKSNVTKTGESAPRRGRPAATITLQSPLLMEMDSAHFDAAVEALANVIRNDWDAAEKLLSLDSPLD
jgi:hypothetical protein